MPVQIKMCIYNTLGQCVRTLYGGEMVPGAHKLFWDAANDNGFRMPTGIYFIHLVSERFDQPKKMILLE